MNKTTFHSAEISCDGCVKAIKAELSEIEGVKSVAGDPDKQEIVVEYDRPATTDGLKAAMDDIGYPVDAVR